MRPGQATWVASPTEDYQKRLASREELASALKERHGQIGGARFAAAIVIIATVWWLHVTHALSSAWIVLPLAIFVAAAYVRSRAASISHSFSAIRCFRTWNDDNERPNCLRSLV